VYFAVPRARWSGAARSLGQYEARYDGELQNVDQNLGRFFEGVKRLGRWTNTTVVVLGAYGVGFGESGVIIDSGTFSDCDLHVPVIVRPAAAVSGGDKGGDRGREKTGPKSGEQGGEKIRTQELFSLVDLAPTLLDLQGIPVPPSMRGVSHASAIRGKIGSPREIAFAAGGLQAGFAVIDARYCFEESSPGALEQEAVSPLSISWYGDDSDHRKDVRRVLHDRIANPSSRHLQAVAENPAAAARLEAAGRDYYDWIEKARALLQAGSGALEGVDRATLDELRRRGLLGEDAGKP
jgi:uncharacterized membrane protein